MQIILFVVFFVKMSNIVIFCKEGFEDHINDLFTLKEPRMLIPLSNLSNF